MTLRGVAVVAAAAAVAAALMGVGSPHAAAAPAPGHSATSRPAACNTSNLPAGVARCYAEVAVPRANGAKPSVDGPPATALSPSDIRSAYALPATGDGQTVGIVDAYGYSTAESDLAVYRAQYGLPACTTANGCFRKVDQRGGTDYPRDDVGWSEESALDMDAVSAACPKCHILYVTGDTPNLSDLGIAVDTAVRLGAKYVSNSYGVDNELAGQKAFDAHYDHPGVAVTVSAGDSGNVQSWPSTNPHVIAVGGTLLTRDAATPRGWTESAWASGGSGCSLYEPEPDWQRSVTTDCAHRATADISADADPQSGLAVYDSLADKDWQQFGGTSLSSPLVAAMYALAGVPTAGRYPVQDLYVAQGRGLNDVTTGVNGTCGTVLCTAGPGWDGPTGFGSPHGTQGVAPVAHGALTGTVTTAGGPVSGATVSAVAAGTDPVGYHATTDATGRYSLEVLPGRYTVSVSDFGFGTVTGQVSVVAGASQTFDATLVRVPSRTVSGRVVDGSGHGWPLGADITIDGYPGGVVHSDPVSGRWSVSLPQRATYQLHVDPELPGYTTRDVSVTVGSADVTTNIAVPVDSATCTAPGYAPLAHEDFGQWTGSTAQDGWGVADAAGASAGTAWTFGSDVVVGSSSLPNWAGQGSMAYQVFGAGQTVDTTLTSPALDLRHQTTPAVAFDYVNFEPSFTVEQSIDGSRTWTTLGTVPASTAFAGAHISFAMSGAAGKNGVRVRFHIVSGSDPDASGLAELDNVLLGGCSVVPGGLVRGRVSDGNTHRPVPGATVSTPAATGSTGADGVYELFSPAGRQPVTARADRYASTTVQTQVRKDTVNVANVSLPAAALSVSTSSVSLRGELGSSASATVTLTNPGARSVTVSTQEQAGAFAGLGGAPATAWTSLPKLPQSVLDNVVAYHAGTAYSFGGTTDFVSPHTFVHDYAYDPASHAWRRLADAPRSITLATGAFIGDTFYVVGGLGDDPADPTQVSGTTGRGWAYHPSSDTWTAIAALPSARAFAASTVLDGSLYVIGGCTGSCAADDDAVFRYDPTRNTWQRRASLPMATRPMCGTLPGGLLCVGGLQSGGKAWTYDPNRNTWSAVASAPQEMFLGRATSANGKVQVIGVRSSDFGSAAFQYDPVVRTWSTLPTPIDGRARFGAACGVYAVGGSDFSSFLPSGTNDAERLAGYDQCAGDNVPWLSESPTSLTIAPGSSATLTVAADSRDLAQPGTYQARVLFATNGPSTPPAIDVSYTVDPPRTWAQISGSVTRSDTRAPVAQATVQMCTLYSASTGRCDRTVTVSTDAQGRYVYWLDARNGPVQVTASHDGFTPASRVVTLQPGATVVADLALAPSASPSATASTSADRNARIAATRVAVRAR